MVGKPHGRESIDISLKKCYRARLIDFASTQESRHFVLFGQRERHYRIGYCELTVLLGRLLTWGSLFTTTPKKFCLTTHVCHRCTTQTRIFIFRTLINISSSLMLRRCLSTQPYPARGVLEWGMRVFNDEDRAGVYRYWFTLRSQTSATHHTTPIIHERWRVFVTIE